MVVPARPHSRSIAIARGIDRGLDFFNVEKGARGIAESLFGKLGQAVDNAVRGKPTSAELFMLTKVIMANS